MIIFTAWKVSKYGVFLGPYFPVFGLNTEIHAVFFTIWNKFLNNFFLWRQEKNCCSENIHHRERSIGEFSQWNDRHVWCKRKIFCSLKNIISSLPMFTLCSVLVGSHQYHNAPTHTICFLGHFRTTTFDDILRFDSIESKNVYSEMSFS